MALAQEAIRLAVVNAGLLGLIGAPTYPMLRDVTERAVISVLEENQIPYEFQKQERLLTLTEIGSEIIFRSLEIPERLVGTNLAWFGVDELTYCKEAGFLRLQARLRHPMAKELCGFGVWTPNGFDWVYSRFIGPDALTGYTAILAQPYENSYLPGDFYARLTESYDQRLAGQEVLGEYLNLTSGRVYFAFSRADHVRDCAYANRQQLCWSLDFNVNPMSSVICQIEEIANRTDMLLGRRAARVSVLDELVLPNSNTAEACDEFVNRVRPWIAGSTPVSLRVYGDAAGAARSTAGLSDYQIIREFFARRTDLFRVTYHQKAANPAVKDRVNAVNSLLCNAAGERRLVIDPRCKQLVKDLEQVCWKADSNGNLSGQIDKSDPARTHISDALGYLVETEFGLKQSGGPRSGYVA